MQAVPNSICVFYQSMFIFNLCVMKDQFGYSVKVSDPGGQDLTMRGKGIELFQQKIVL